MVGIRKYVLKKLTKLFANNTLHQSVIKENEEKFRTIIELAPDAFFQGDIKGNFITVNNKATELTGYSKDELLALNISDLFPKAVLKENPLRYDLLKKGATIKNERELMKKNGNIIQVEMNSKAMPDGTYQSFVRDITERKKAEEVIKVSETRLKRAELTSKAGNWELHLDTQIMVASIGATKIYGVAENQMDFSIIKKVPLTEYRSLLDKALKDLIENNQPYDIEFKIKAVDTGEIKDIHSIAIFDREKRILFGAIQDITDRKKVEEELIKAKEKAEESDRLKTSFLQNLSHEIRTPMNAIIGFSELMKDDFDDKEKIEKYSDIINQRCNDLLDIINDILDIARIDSGQLPVNLEECDINSLFKELNFFFKEYQYKINRQHINLDLQNIFLSSEPIIVTDKVKLKQILINLINNALKFTEEGSVRGGCKLDNGNNLLFYISDTGIGIPPDKQEVIFERFTQLNQMKKMNIGGNGLGLSIVKGLVNLLGGEIFLESEPGKGTTFSFTIPYKTALNIKPDKKDVVKHTNKGWSNKTVLIVEDDFYNAEYLKELLSGVGLQTIQAGNGNEAVLALKTKSVDLVLMDIRLPDINGYEVTRLIRQFKPDLKIIAQTAYVSSDEKQRAMNAGCNDYLSKPTKKELLLSMINKHLDVS